ncbi:MFS general substrate transporter [Ramicandelaber brevisporus]|nr:MFS general substrate transporter [Ramicandelaber brevisporus]
MEEKSRVAGAVSGLEQEEAVAHEKLMADATDDCVTTTHGDRQHATAAIVTGKHAAFLVLCCVFAFGATFSYVVSFAVAQSKFLDMATSPAAQNAIQLIGTMNTGVTNFLGSAAGLAVNRFGFRPVMFTGSMLCVLGVLLTSFTAASNVDSGVWLLIVGHVVLMSVGCAMIMIPCLSLPSVALTHRQGLATGLVAASQGAGGLFFPIVMQALINTVGVSWMLRIIALIILLVSGGCSLLIRLPSNSVLSKSEKQNVNESLTTEDENSGRSPLSAPSEASHPNSCESEHHAVISRQHQQHHHHQQLTGGGIIMRVLNSIMDFSLFKDKRFIVAFAAYFFTGVLYFAPFYHISTYASRNGISTEDSARLVSALGGGLLAGSLILGAVCTDFIGPLNMAILSRLLATLSLLCVWLPAKFGSIAACIAFGVLYGMSCGCLFAVGAPMSARVWGRDKTARVTGTLYSGFGIAAFIGSPIATALISIPSKAFGPFIVTNGCFAALSAVLFILLRLMATKSFKLFIQI